MTNEEAEQHYQNLLEQYGDKLPSPEHEPLQFAYIMKLYKYYNLTDKTSPRETVHT